MTCSGCKHYIIRMESCNALTGVVHCKRCDLTWELNDHIGCNRCTEWKSLVDVSECPEAVPSTHCPGRVAIVEPPNQGRLF